MPKKYNILNDKVALRTILETLGNLCQTHENCLYCPFHDGDYCMLVVNSRTPMEYFEKNDD